MVGVMHDITRIKAFWNHDGGHTVGVPLWAFRTGLKAPCGNRLTNPFGQSGMTRVNIIHPFLEHQFHGFFESIEEWNGGGVREIAARVMDHVVIDIEESSVTGRLFTRRQGLLAKGKEGKARGEHEAFLCPRQGHVNTPIIETKFERTD